MFSRKHLILLCLIAVGVVGPVSSCVEGGSPNEGQDGRRVVRAVPVDFDQRVVVPTSVLTFRMQGTERILADTATVSFAGNLDAAETLEETYDAVVEREGDVGQLVVRLPAEATLWPTIGQRQMAPFEGSIHIVLTDGIGPVAEGRIDGAQLIFQSSIAPTIQPFALDAVHAAERVPVSGNGFLRPEEGQTVALIQSGEVVYGDGSTRAIAGEAIALEWDGLRQRAAFPVTPAVFGVQPVDFSLTVTFENRLSNGEVMPGSGQTDLAGRLQESFIARLEPTAGSRGQRVEAIGRGLVRNDDASGVGMFLRYQGELVPDDPNGQPIDATGQNYIDRPPDAVISEEVAVQSVWYEVTDGRILVGLGAEPGVFTGRIYPVLFDAWGDHIGVPWEGEFRVLPAKQVVYLKYLPAFSKGLEKYGLRNVERDIRDRVIEVVRRDYTGVNIAFTEEAPSDFVDYAAIEMGGPDPSGGNSFGYDNTFHDVAKDTGNLYLTDYLGGVNRQAAEEFGNGYGGVFIESFSFFSPTLNPGNEFTSEHFDRILGPFMPALGGDPVQGSEWPDGARAPEIAQAVRMVGNVIGNTVTHEIGHSLGLTYFPADDESPTNQFHNQIPGPYIMDAGADRSFEERAELAGEGPARWNERNRAYLERILPVR